MVSVRHRLIAFLLSLGVLVGCGGAAADEEGSRSLRPGDSLFDLLSEAIVERYGTFSLPDAVRDGLPGLLGGRRFVVEPEDWVSAEPLPAGSPYARPLRITGDVPRWRSRPPVDPDLPLGSVAMRHDGRPLPRRAEEGADGGELVWLDETSRHLFFWDRRAEVLVALGAEAPGTLDWGWPDDDGSFLARWAVGESPPTEAAELVERWTLAHVDRPALVAPAPTTIVVEAEGAAVDALDVGVAVLDFGLARRDDRWVRADGASDGVTFAVEVEQGGPPRRVWSRHVTPGGGWSDERIELGPVAPGPLRLRLVTEPGPEGDADFDFALWSGLRLRGAPRRAPERPHVVFVDVDTLRADRLGCYGAERETSPRIDAWAAQNAVVYTDVVSANDWTLPSTVSMLTGLAVSQHGVHDMPSRITPSLEPLAAVLRDAGYETRARTDAGFVIPTFGFAIGFDHFDSERRLPADHQADGWRGELEWLRRRRSERPVFLFLHTYQVHAPLADDRRFEDPTRRYDGPLADEPVQSEHVRRLVNRRGGALLDEDRRYLRDVYDAGVRRMDDVVGELLEGLDEAFGGEPYLVVLTSDHGEELGERGVLGHGHSLHRELLRVPLVVRYPDRELVGRRDEPVTSLDIVPTVLDVAGLPIPERLPGRSLRETAPGPRLRVAQHKRAGHAVHFDGHKLITGTIDKGRRQREVHDLYGADDVEELRPLTEDERGRRLADMLADYLRRYGLVGGDVGAAELDADTLADLRALGYLDGD